MIYKDLKNLKLSNLGLGMMRLPTKGENGDAPIDEEETAKMIDYAIKNGIELLEINYKNFKIADKLLEKYLTKFKK